LKASRDATILNQDGGFVTGCKMNFAPSGRVIIKPKKAKETTSKTADQSQL